MAIYITGDTHGEFTRFRPLFFPEQADLTKEDYVLICGDFGGVWDGGQEDSYWLDWLEERPFTTLFIDGNHENFDLLATYPLHTWHGGLVQYIRPSVIHLTRGQVFHIQDLTFFVMGGARSHDIAGGILNPNDPLFKQKHRQLTLQGMPHRINHVTWWQEELPCEAEYQTARANLERQGWAVDYIVSHCCPTTIQNTLEGKPRHPDALTDFLEEVSLRCQFQAWFFGHYHSDRIVKKKYVLLHEQLRLLNPYPLSLTHL